MAVPELSISNTPLRTVKKNSCSAHPDLSRPPLLLHLYDVIIRKRYTRLKLYTFQTSVPESRGAIVYIHNPRPAFQQLVIRKRWPEFHQSFTRSLVSLSGLSEQPLLLRSAGTERPEDRSGLLFFPAKYLL